MPLESRSSHEIVDQVCHLMPEWSPAHVNVVEFLDGGYSNENYRVDYQGDSYVLRLPVVNQPFVDRTLEQQWYQALHSSNARHITLQPLALDEASGSMLTQWVRGTLLVDYARQLPSEALGELLGAYVGRLHRALPDTSRIYHVGELASRYVDEMQSDAEVPHNITCHNDLNPWNIIVTDSDWITLDWEFVGLHDPLFDLIALHQGLELERDVFSEMLAAYSPDGSIEQTRIAGNLKNFWLREWSWARFQIDHGNQRQEIIDQAASAHKRLIELSV